MSPSSLIRGHLCPHSLCCDPRHSGFHAAYIPGGAVWPPTSGSRFPVPHLSERARTPGRLRLPSTGLPNLWMMPLYYCPYAGRATVRSVYSACIPCLERQFAKMQAWPNPPLSSFSDYHQYMDIANLLPFSAC